MKQFAIRLAAMFSLLVLAQAQTKRIYIGADDHTDYMWTASEEAYREAYLQMTDYYLDLADKTQTNPPADQSRWNFDGTLWLWTYEKNRTPAEFARLIARLRDGHMSVPLNALVSTYGGTPIEAILRGMYYAGTLERRFGLRIPLAIAMENQTLPYGLEALWAGSGAQYSWKGICGCLTKINKNERRPHEIYWWRGDDGSRILMKWNSLTAASGARTMGGYAEARTPAKEIDFVDSSAEFRAAYPYSVIGIFGKGWDDLKTTTDEFVRVAEAASTPERKVIVSNTTDFFQDFEKTFGNALPTFSASFGNEWDLYTASITELAARVRRAVEKLRAAEALSSIIALQRPAFLNNRQVARDQAWMNLGLFWEHNWTADGPVISRLQRAEWGRKVANGVETYVDSLYADSAFALGSMVKTSGSNRRFYAFNPLSWERSDFADVPFESTGPVHVVDLTTGLETPSQIVDVPDTAGSSFNRCLRILASGLPPVGYKTFEVRDGKGVDYPNAATVNGSVFENEIYRLGVEDRGAIRSFIDKAQANREFAGSLQNGRLLINDLGYDPGLLSIENAGPVSVTLKASGVGPLSHTSRITLFRDLRRVDIRNDINENFDGTYSWNFSFNLQHPDVHHEEVGAVVHAKLLADGGVYSPVMSRLEWLTLNHFADMSGDGNVGVTLSNADCAFMKLGDSSIVDGVSRLDTDTPQIQVLAGGQIDAPQAGIPKQGGEKHFLQRFALQTHGPYKASDAMRFSLEHQNPPVTGWLQGRGTLPEKSYSILSIVNPDVLLWTLKPADDGIQKGLVTRVWNLNERPGTYTLALAAGASQAVQTTHLETDLAPLNVSEGKVTNRIEQWQMQTVRITPARASSR